MKGEKYIKSTSEEDIWKDIKGYEGIYKYNPLTGKIMSVGGRRGGHKEDYILGEYLDSDGYPMVILKVNGNSRTCRVHKIIAINEIPNPNGYNEVDHINGDRTDNRSCNLRWLTHGDNINNPITKDRMVTAKRDEGYRKKMSDLYKGRKLSDETKKKMSESRTGKKNYKSKTVYQYTLDGELVGVYESANIAAKETNCLQSGISLCCLGKFKKHKGYKWSYSPL